MSDERTHADNVVHLRPRANQPVSVEYLALEGVAQSLLLRALGAYRAAAVARRAGDLEAEAMAFAMAHDYFERANFTIAQLTAIE